MVLDLFDADAILLSPSAAEWLGLKAGDALAIQVGTRAVTLKVVGLLPQGAYRQRVRRHGRRGRPMAARALGAVEPHRPAAEAGHGQSRPFAASCRPCCRPACTPMTPETEGERGASLTRAYRLNLDMLALVALFTGAFLVFSSQVLALLRRRSQFALLRAIGVTRGALAAQLLAEGAVIGVDRLRARPAARLRARALRAARWSAPISARAISAALPRASTPSPARSRSSSPSACCSRCWAPPRRHGRPRAGRPRRRCARVTRRKVSGKLRTLWWGMASIAAGLLLALAPAVNGLPLAGYVAIALILLGAVLVMPWLAGGCLGRLPLPARAPLAIAIAQLKATPRQAAISVAAIVISFSLMVSMLIMVSSFRASLETWLERMLPADLYLRAGALRRDRVLHARRSRRASPRPRESSASSSYAARTCCSRRTARRSCCSPDRSKPATPGKVLPLTSPRSRRARTSRRRYGCPRSLRISTGLRVGERVQLPIGGVPRPTPSPAIWRDYARQSGAIAMNRELYVKLTGDRLVNDVALWLAAGRRHCRRSTRAARAAARCRGLRDRHHARAARDLAPGIRPHVRHHLRAGNRGGADRAVRRERLLQRAGARPAPRVRRAAPSRHDAARNRRDARLRRRAGGGPGHRLRTRDRLAGGR